MVWRNGREEKMKKLVIVLLTTCLITDFVDAGAVITPVSSQYHVWGGCDGESYDTSSSDPVSGGCSGQVGGFWNTSESQAGRIDNKLQVNAQAVMYSYPEWSNTWAFAELTFTFTTDSPSISLSFDGISADHTFESWTYFVFKDVLNALVLDNRIWTFEFDNAYGEPPLPCQLSYLVFPGREYSVTIGAHAMAGDGGIGLASLDAILTPEPASLLLMGLGVLLARKKVNSRHAV